MTLCDCAIRAAADEVCSVPDPIMVFHICTSFSLIHSLRASDHFSRSFQLASLASSLGFPRLRCLGCQPTALLTLPSARFPHRASPQVPLRRFRWSCSVSSSCHSSIHFIIDFRRAGEVLVLSKAAVRSHSTSRDTCITPLVAPLVLPITSPSAYIHCSRLHS